MDYLKRNKDGVGDLGEFQAQAIDGKGEGSGLTAISETVDLIGQLKAKGENDRANALEADTLKNIKSPDMREVFVDKVGLLKQGDDPFAEPEVKAEAKSKDGLDPQLAALMAEGETFSEKDILDQEGGWKESVERQTGHQLTDASATTARSAGVVTVTPGKGNSGVAGQTSQAGSKLIPGVARRVAGAVGGLVIPGDDGARMHDVTVGDQEMSIDYRPGDLGHQVVTDDPDTGEPVASGYVAFEAGKDDEGNQRFDLVPEAQVEDYLSGKLSRTDMAEPLPAVPPSTASGPEAGYREEFPPANPTDNPSLPGYPDQSGESGPSMTASPDQSGEFEQGQRSNMDIGVAVPKRDQEIYQKGYDEWFEKEGRGLAEKYAEDPIKNNVAPSQSYFWKKLGKQNSLGFKKDAEGNNYSWDYGGAGRHGAQIEKWSKSGKHLGTYNPLTGKEIHGRVPKRDRPQEKFVMFGDDGPTYA